MGARPTPIGEMTDTPERRYRWAAGTPTRTDQVDPGESGHL